MKWLFAYLLIINIAGFAEMGIDKRRAVRRQWRIPEKTLFLTAAAGGSIGSMLGMKVFRHKTRHKSFTAGMPAIFTIQAVIAVLAVIYLGF